MARKKRASSGPSNAYLVSFGDTMTALLAFFIVLNSLASEQTGANLYSGTGSFVSVGDSAGVPGLFAMGNSAYPVQMHQSSPIYIISSDEADPGSSTEGPDKDGDAMTVQDREQDELKRFLMSMEDAHTTQTQSKISGEVAFDRMAPLPREGELVDHVMKEQLLQFAPVIRRPGYELEIRVWASTPAPSAWERAAIQSVELRAGVVEFLKLTPEEARAITTKASPWHSKTIKRPTASFLVRRVQ